MWHTVKLKQWANRRSEEREMNLGPEGWLQSHQEKAGCKGETGAARGRSGGWDEHAHRRAVMGLGL